MVVTPVTKYLIDSVLANWNLFLLMMCEGLGERGRAILQMMDWLGKVTGKGIGMIGAGHGMSNEKQVSRHGIKGESIHIKGDGKGVTNLVSGEMEVQSQKDPEPEAEGVQVDETPRWKQHTGKSKGTHNSYPTVSREPV